jgi:hypothetical protein
MTPIAWILAAVLTAAVAAWFIIPRDSDQDK